ncbi:MBL fold metallo-hydrolase [Desulfosporosinus sp. SYSU MS00001]|uniref:MBL fold metallo-hydrolase n=1 Tax=Desulfosporosinus sp. SYSU MS00001 TaxID=3416284 RepID=UPI003CEC9E3F
MLDRLIQFSFKFPMVKTFLLILVNTGNKEDYGTISSYLNKQGVNKIDTLVLTHMHEDHIGSSPEILKNFMIGQVVMPKESANTQVFKDLVSVMGSKGLSPVQAKAGLKLDFGSEYQRNS